MRIIQVGAMALGLALAVVPASPARGATVLRLSFEELATRAEAVVRGRVVSSTARRDAASGRIFTYTEVEVTEAVKGAPGKKVTVRQPGGEVGGIGQSVAGAARFAPGEEVVLFLEKARDEASTSFQVLSMSAGKVRLEKRLSSVRAVRDLDGIQFPDQPAKDAARSGVKVVSSQDLGDGEAFLTRVRTAVRAGAKASPKAKAKAVKP